MEGPRWLADEMVGRLARYLRFMGQDTAYVRDLDHEQIERVAREESRTLLTRCRALALRVPGTLLLRSTTLPDQLRSVRSAAPHARFELTFERCSLCNGRLDPWTPPTDEPWPEEVPGSGPGTGLVVYRCPDCGHRFWEGSHTAAIRLRVASWLA